MSLTKKDPSFCVAANDPHLVSLGGGRLSTAVTIHNIPIGDTTIGSSTRCSISLNGSGVLPLHCTIYRSEENEVTLVPERDARILIDGSKVTEETNLTQGAMITIGKSYYLRFNNPAEAQQIRTAMGSCERVSMPQIDFSPAAQGNPNQQSQFASGDKNSYEIDSFYQSTFQPATPQSNRIGAKACNTYANLAPIDINGLQCPKVFTADLVTVNMPAEDVLGLKYTRFAKNVSDNQPNGKNMNNVRHNNNLNQATTTSYKMNYYDNVTTVQQNSSIKVKNTAKTTRGIADAHRQAVKAHDRYPKLGNLKIFPMNSVNNDINANSKQPSLHNRLEHDDREENGNVVIPAEEKNHLDDMLKICAEYTDRQYQNGSSAGNVTSSPVIQNRIKTNGSLPRERKSPFPQDTQNSIDGNFSYETLTIPELESRIISPKHVEINDQNVESPKDNYENVVVGKFVPQSPRTKIRTNCMSPKREQSFSGISSQNTEAQQTNKDNSKPSEYDELLKTLGEKLEIEMEALQENRHYTPPTASNSNFSNKPRKNMNMNNLKLQIKLPSSLQNSPKLNKKPAPAPRTLMANSGAARIGSLPHLSANSRTGTQPTNMGDLQIKANSQNALQVLQEKIRRLEAQRNATRVMEENQQAKLKQSIEMKSDQVDKLKAMLKEKKDNECLKDELKHIIESLENDRKQFEDLEFQYLEEESEWHAYHEELRAEERQLAAKVDEQLKRGELHISDVRQEYTAAHSSSQRTAAVDIEKPYDIREAIGIMSQSLFGSAELLCPKRINEDVMSRSVNENMFFNNKIELPSNVGVATSTPKRLQLQIVNISDESLVPDAFINTAGVSLSLANDDFEVNPLEKRVPSQDDIDRISKVTSDAPITSSEGASTKIFDSIREIERNRQLLLAQHGHHVIEHERQKMNDLKKKSHSEARAQYLSMLDKSTSPCLTNHNVESKKQPPQDHLLMDKENFPSAERNNYISVVDTSNQQRHSQPEFESSHLHQLAEQNKRHSSSSRPLSETNSDLSCDISTIQARSDPNVALTAADVKNVKNTEDARLDISNLHDQSIQREGNERKRILPKHQRPLTRYLPIFSPDLDLRQHIESAGHQIALCPHVIVDAHSCRGYLHKLGATFHGWSKRWFVLDRQRNALIYYSDKLERKPRGGAYFSTIDEVYLDHLNASKSGRPHCTFIVKTKKRSYQLQAASDAAARIWIDAIITGAQGSLDY